jgi:hypothetical protein
MSLTSKQWYKLGFQTGKVSNILTRLWFTLNSKYGKTNIYTKLLNRLYKYLVYGLQSNLDDLVGAAYSMNVHYLSGYEDISITDVFYNINRYTCEEANSFSRRVRPLPKSLTSEEMEDFKQSISYITTFINKVDMMFKNKNKHIKYMKKELVRLESFFSNRFI